MDSFGVEQLGLAGMRSELEKMKLAEPATAHLPRGEYVSLIGDFLVAALQSGLTRVATMMAATEQWDTPYRFEEISGKPLSHYALSHGGFQSRRSWRGHPAASKCDSGGRRSRRSIACSTGWRCMEDVKSISA
jgi:hypothetical protein